MNDVDAIIPVAGLSSRMGKWKPALPWKGKLVLQQVVAKALAVAPRVIVVTGFKAEAVEKLLPKEGRLLTVHNHRYATGLLSSIQAALPLVEADSFLIILGDMPEVPLEVVSGLLDVGLGPSQERWVRPKFRGKPGHPVRIHRSLIPELLELDPVRQEMRDVLRKHPGSFLETAEPGVYQDLDTPEDFDRMRRRIGPEDENN